MARARGTGGGADQERRVLAIVADVEGRLRRHVEAEIVGVGDHADDRPLEAPGGKQTHDQTLAHAAIARMYFRPWLRV